MARWDTPVVPIHAQKLAVAHLEWACDGGGVGLDHPTYRLVASMSEDRRAGRSRNETARIQGWRHPFSSCAFLGHWLLEVLGVRLPWVGRDIPKNPLSRLAWATRQDGSALARTPQGAEDLSPGDIFVVWNDTSPNTKDAHVECVIDSVPASGIVQVAAYGQPGGALRTRMVGELGGKVTIGGRVLRRHLPLLEVLREAQAHGLLEDPLDPGQTVP